MLDDNIIRNMRDAKLMLRGIKRSTRRSFWHLQPYEWPRESGDLGETVEQQLQQAEAC